MSNSPYSPPPAHAPQPAPSEEVIFAPLPLRTRGVLENLDVAFKLFKQYWKPMLGWAATTNLLMTIANYFALLVGPPLLIAPTCCVLAAALRGQNVGFKACWRFTRPRLGNLMAVHVLSGLASALLIALLLLGIFMAGTWLGTALPLGGFWSVLLIILATILMSVVVSMVLAWQGMVGMASCMEDDSRDVRAMKRAWILLRGRWKAAVGLLTILNLGLLALLGILYGFFGLLLGAGAFGKALSGKSDDMAVIGLIGGVVVSGWLLFTLYLPIYYLAQAMFYLDARVRHEALDLEWNAHRAHQAAPMAAQAHAPSHAPQTFFERIETPAPSPFAPPAPASNAAVSLQNPEPNAPDAAADARQEPADWSDNSPFAPR